MFLVVVTVVQFRHYACNIMLVIVALAAVKNLTYSSQFTVLEHDGEYRYMNSLYTISHSHGTHQRVELRMVRVAAVCSESDTWYILSIAKMLKQMLPPGD